MLLGILSDTHNEIARTRVGVQLLRDNGAQALIHCGDLSSPPIVAACSVLPFWFAFGNHDSDTVPDLHRAAIEHGAHCLGWGGIVELSGKKIGVVHGHMTSDKQRILAEKPDYLLSGHSHFPSDEIVASTRRINSGALHRADEYTVALLDLVSNELRFLLLPA